MQENVGNRERWVRVAIGSGLVLAGVRGLARSGRFLPATLIACGSVVLDTAITRVCPLNAAFGAGQNGWDDRIQRLASVASERTSELCASEDEVVSASVQRPAADS